MLNYSVAELRFISFYLEQYYSNVNLSKNNAKYFDYKSCIEMGHSNLKHCQISRHLSWMQRNNVTENNIVFSYCCLV